MAKEKIRFEGDPSDLIAAQQKIIKKQSEIVSELKKTRSSTEKTGSAMTKVGQDTARAVVGMVASWVSVGAAVGGVRRLINGVKEDMLGAAKAASALVQATAPLAVMGGPRTKEDWTLAMRYGVQAPEIGAARVAATAAIPSAKLREDILQQVSEMRHLFPRETPTGMALALGEFAAATKGTGEQAQAAAIFLEAKAKGEFGELARYGGRAVGVSTGLGLTGAQGLGLFATLTNVPGLTGEQVSTIQRALLSRSIGQAGAGWQKVGAGGQAPLQALVTSLGAYKQGRISQKDLIDMYGQETLPGAIGLAERLPMLEKLTAEAGEYLGPGAPDWGKQGMQAFIKSDPYVREMLENARIEQQISHRKYQRRMAGAYQARADAIFEEEMERIGGAWGPTWSKAKFWATYPIPSLAGVEPYMGVKARYEPYAGMDAGTAAEPAQIPTESIDQLYGIGMGTGPRVATQPGRNIQMGVEDPGDE